MLRNLRKHGPLGRKDFEDLDNLEDLRPRWRLLFTFTARAHSPVLVTALGFSIVSGLVIPTLALFLGKIFNSFTDYGAGNITSDELSNNVTQNIRYLAVLAAANCLLSGGYFVLWLLFGELQAKSARDKLYDGMLYKDMEWFEMRKAGVNALMPRLQTYV